MIGEKLTVIDAQAQGRRWLKKSERVEKPVGEWNTARIRCQGEKATVWINGILMNEGIGPTTNKGAICLQGEGGETHFRKAEVTPSG